MSVVLDRCTLKKCARRCWRNLLAILNVLLHRAWISTLGVVVVGFLLMRNDQSRDVLRGLGEALVLFDRLGRSLSSRTGLSAFDSAYAWYGVIAYLAFWASAVLLAAALALVAYVTGRSNHAWHELAATPGHGGGWIYFRRAFSVASTVAPRETEKHAVWHSAQIIVLATLGIIYLTVLWQMRQTSPAMIALPVILLTIIFVPWRVLASVRPNYGTPRRLTISALISMIFAVPLFYTIIIVRLGDSLVLAASAATPSLAMLAMAAVRPRLPAEYQSRVNVLFISALLLSVAVFYPWWPSAIWTIGSAAIALIWFAWAALILAIVVVVLRHLRGTVGIDPIIPLLLIGLWLFTGEERLGRESLPVDPSAQRAAAANAKAPDQPSTAGKAENSAALPGPSLAIHADGGGLRAALFTAEVLAIADDMTCGDFGEHVTAASGVSGGSLGIATWAVMRQEYKEINGNKGAWSVCKKLREDIHRHTPDFQGRRHFPLLLDFQDEWHFPLSFRVSNILAQDHLSFALATMLTWDLLPGVDPKRGQALLDSWQVAAHDVLNRYDKSTLGSRQAFAMHLKNVNAGLTRKPLLMFTATDADSGKRLVFLNKKPAASSSTKDVQILEDVQVGVAALHSARFPLISPAGRAAVGDNERRAVDGGYFDNSGAATLRDVFGNVLNEKVKVVRIDGNASDSEDPACGTFHNALINKGVPYSIPPLWTAKPESEPSSWSGLKAFMAARTALANETADSLEPLHLQLKYYSGFDRNCELWVLSKDFKKDSPPPCVEHNSQVCWAGLLQPRAPLGWYLSRSAAGGIHQSASEEALQLLLETGLLPVHYPVNDVDAAVAWYTKHLGFKLLSNQTPAFAELTRGTLRFLLSGATSPYFPMQHREWLKPGGWVRIPLIVNNLHAEVERLRGSGVQFQGDIVTGPGGSHILLIDPSENLIELFQPARR